jgi:hypothetical protein
MNFYPTLKIELKTSLTVEEVMERIKKRSEPENHGQWLSNKKYIGRVGKTKFILRNQFFYIRGAKPEIKGSVESQEIGCKINIVVSPTIYSKVFSGFAFTFLGLGCIIMTIEAIMKREFSWWILFPYALFLFLYGMLWAVVFLGTEPDEILIRDLLGMDPQLIS